jgi:hypothetical protein
VRTAADRAAAARAGAIELDGDEAAGAAAELPAPKRARHGTAAAAAAPPGPPAGAEAVVEAEPDAVAAAWPALFHQIRRQPFDQAEHDALAQRYLAPRKIPQPDRETVTRRGVTVSSRGDADGPPAIEQFGELAQTVRRHKAAGEDEAVLYHLRCLAEWQSRYQPRGVVAPSIVSAAAAGGEDDVVEAFDLTGEDEEQTAEIDVERWIAECWVERVVKADPDAAVGGGAAARPAAVARVKAEPAAAVEAAVEQQEEQEGGHEEEEQAGPVEPAAGAQAARAVPPVPASRPRVSSKGRPACGLAGR